MDNCTFAENLKELRTERAMTQIEFAKRFNFTQTTIAMWETGKRIPDARTIIKLADFFNITCDYLLKGTKQQNNGIKYIAEYYGLTLQIEQLEEELAELILAIQKNKRNHSDATIDNFIEEIADVEIMFEQIKHLLGCNQNIQRFKECKIQRQLERIKGI